MRTSVIALLCLTLGMVPPASAGDWYEKGVAEGDYRSQTIKVAYLKSPCRSCVESFLDVVKGTEITPILVTFEQIRTGELATSNYDVFHIPGGGRAAELYGKNGKLGAIGQQKVRQFIASGGGYLGICGGAYAGSHDPDRDYCMGLANVKIVSSGTGDGDIEIRMEKGASEIFASPKYLPPTVRNIRHANGPLWEIHDGNKPLYVAAAFTGRTDTRDFRPDHPCAQPGGFFAGHPCIVYGFYGKGRVVLCSSHPELADKATGNAAMIPEIIRWIAGRTARPKKKL